MSTVSAEHWNVGKVEFECEFDLTAAAAVSTAAGGIRGDDIVVTKTGTGIYTVRLVGRTFYEVLFRTAELNRATPTSNYAAITDVDLDGAGDGTGAVITVKTFDDNATPTAIDVSAVGTISIRVVFRKSKVT